MSHLPIDPHADSNKRAWLPCPNCNPDCPHCRGIETCETHWQFVLGDNGHRIRLQCPTCAHTWTADAAGDEVRQGRWRPDNEAVVATLPLGGRPGELATAPSGHVYVLVEDSVKVINRSHHIVAKYPTGPHPKKMILSADGTRLIVTGFDGSTTVIDIAGNTVKTFALQRSTAEAVSPDGQRIYLLHSGIVGDTKGSWVSVISASGTSIAVVPVGRHAIGFGVRPDGTKLYVSSRNSSSSLDWRGFISVIDTGTCRVVDKIAVELAPDTLTVSRDGGLLYATHYHKNSISIIDLRTRRITRWQFRDAPVDIAISPYDDFAYVTNLQSLIALNITANLWKSSCAGRLPRALQLGADGKRAYTIDVGQRSIFVLDTSDNSVIASLGVDGRPAAMALGADGEFLYLTDTLDDTVKVIATRLLNDMAER